MRGPPGVPGPQGPRGVPGTALTGKASSIIHSLGGYLTITKYKINTNYSMVNTCKIYKLMYISIFFESSSKNNQKTSICSCHQRRR